MPPLIELSETTFRRLQSLATPFVDSPESVIIKLLDRTNIVAKGGTSALPGTQSSAHFGAKILMPDNPGDLRHTKISTARFAERTADNWNDLIVTAHQEAMRRLGNFEAVRTQTISAVDKNRRDDSGYHYHQSIGFSIQNVDANNAWRQVLNLAKKLGTAVEVEFSWRDKEGAAHPGEQGLLKWVPN